MTYPESFVQGELGIIPGPPLQVDTVVTLPRLRGVPLAGVPQTEDYFIPVDDSCRVQELDDVLAAGDITTFPVKQGGLAAQQADVAAVTIANDAGAETSPDAFEKMRATSPVDVAVSVLAPGGTIVSESGWASIVLRPASMRADAPCGGRITMYSSGLSARKLHTSRPWK